MTLVKQLCCRFLRNKENIVSYVGHHRYAQVKVSKAVPLHAMEAFGGEEV
jgi:hypothetical protein